MSTVVCSLYAPTPVTTSVVVVRRVASPVTACLGHVQVGGDRAPVRQAGELRGWMPWCGRSHGSPSCKVGQGGQQLCRRQAADIPGHSPGLLFSPAPLLDRGCRSPPQAGCETHRHRGPWLS